jgi:flagellar export protein FliJ
MLVAAETERRRQLLVEADRDVRMLELLDERYRSDYDLENRRQETKQLDEVAIVRRHLQ